MDVSFEVFCFLFLYMKCLFIYCTDKQEWQSGLWSVGTWSLLHISESASGPSPDWTDLGEIDPDTHWQVTSRTTNRPRTLDRNYPAVVTDLPPLHCQLLSSAGWLDLTNSEQQWRHVCLFFPNFVTVFQHTANINQEKLPFSFLLLLRKKIKKKCLSPTVKFLAKSFRL